MKKCILFFLLTIGFFPKINLGCTCASPNSFCESITDENGEVFPEFIIRGKLTESSPEGKTIRVDQFLKGEFNQSEITLGYGICTIFYNELEDGAEYVFALGEANDKFFLVGCAISFLKIENEVVKGKIAPGIESIDYKDLGDLESCGNAFAFIGFEKNINVFPNPTTDVLKIKNISPGVSYNNLELSVFDAIGRAVSFYKKDDGILPDETWDINMQRFASGVYIFKLSGNFQVSYFKIVKQ